MRQPLSSANILLISADFHIAALRKQILQNKGYRVTAMMQSEELPDSFASFDAVILGYSVKAKERAELSKTIRKRDSKIPILTICSVPGEIDRAATVCVSPLEDPEKMLQALQELLIREPATGDKNT